MLITLKRHRINIFKKLFREKFQIMVMMQIRDHWGLVLPDLENYSFTFLKYIGLCSWGLIPIWGWKFGSELRLFVSCCFKK
jgi:hypothetical protein